MDAIAHNFVYDPLRQGADASTWRFYQGQPKQAGSYMSFIESAALMYYDVGRGLVSFTLSVPAPTAGDSRQWGLMAGGDYAVFKINGPVFTAETSQAGTTTSATITWLSSWTSTDTVFAIRWEAGGVYFFVNGYKYAVISDASVPNGALAPFISNESSDALLVRKVMGAGLQSLVLNPVIASGDVLEPMGYASDKISIAESVTVSIPSIDLTASVNDSLSTSESTPTTGVFFSFAISDSVAETESVSTLMLNYLVSVNDAVSASENITSVA